MKAQNQQKPTGRHIQTLSAGATVATIGTSDTVRIPQIEEYLNYADNSVAETIELISLLVHRLSPITHDQPNDDSGKAPCVPEPTLVPVADRLRGLVRQSNRNNNIIRDLMDRLEV